MWIHSWLLKERKKPEQFVGMLVPFRPIERAIDLSIPVLEPITHRPGAELAIMCRQRDEMRELEGSAQPESHCLAERGRNEKFVIQSLCLLAILLKWKRKIPFALPHRVIASASAPAAETVGCARALQASKHAGIRSEALIGAMRYRPEVIDIRTHL